MNVACVTESIPLTLTSNRIVDESMKTIDVEPVALDVTGGTSLAGESVVVNISLTVASETVGNSVLQEMLTAARAMAPAVRIGTRIMRYPISEERREREAREQCPCA